MKATWPYTVQEIAALFGVHKNLPLKWLTEGLQADRSVRPFLIRGDELIRFLRERQSRRKQKCRSDQFYCFKCRTAREAYLGIVDIVIESGTRMRLTTICCVCGTRMNKVQAVRKLLAILGMFSVQRLEGRHLLEGSDPSVNGESEVAA